MFFFKETWLCGMDSFHVLCGFFLFVSFFHRNFCLMGVTRVDHYLWFELLLLGFLFIVTELVGVDILLSGNVGRFRHRALLWIGRKPEGAANFVCA